MQTATFRAGAKTRCINPGCGSRSSIRPALASAKPRRIFLQPRPCHALRQGPLHLAVPMDCTTRAGGAPGGPSSSEELRSNLRQVIAAAAAEQEVPQDLVARLRDEELEMLVADNLDAKALLVRTSVDELHAVGLSRGSAKLLKMLFPDPAEGVAGAAGATELAERIASGGGTSTSGSSPWGAYGPAPCGPPSYNLATEAGELVDEVPQPDCPPCFSRLERDGIEDDFVIDVNHDLRQALQKWLDHCFTRMSSTRFKKGSKHKPLFVNGLTKTGKSFALNTILPAVLRNHPQFGVHGPHQMLMFQLSMDQLSTSTGFDEQVRGLLQELLLWSTRYNVPVRKEAWDLAVAAVRPGSDVQPDRALMQLLHGIQVPVIMLLDEIQAWFTPRNRADGKVYPGDSENARRVFKELMTNGPDWMSWAVTGSSMATFWINVAMTPKGGVALLRQHRMVNLPSSVIEPAMQRCWQALVQQHAPKLQGAELLYKLTGTTPALLSYAVGNWLDDDSPPDLYGYVLRHHYDKLLAEAIDDWRIALEFLGPDARVALYELSSLERGINIRAQLDPGMAHMLEPFTQPVRAGSSRVCLNSAIHRELIQNMVTPDGRVYGLWNGEPQAGSLQHHEAQKLMLKLGNAVVAADAAKWGDDAGKQLKQDLQEMACSLEQTHGPMATWCNTEWFQRVLHSEYNQRGAAPHFRKMWKLHETQQQLLEPWQFVAQYSRMLRNCLGHEEFEDEQLLPGDDGLPLAFKAEDVDLVESWPFAKLARIATAIGPIRSRWLDARSSTGADHGSTKTARRAGVSTAAAKPGHTGSRSPGVLFATVASQLLQTPKQPSWAPRPTIHLDNKWQRNSCSATD